MDMSQRRWIILGLQIVIGVASNVEYVLSVFLLPLQEQRGWDISVIVVAFTLIFWIGPVGNFVGGIVRERVGERYAIMIGGALYGVSVVASALVDSVYAFVVLWGVVSALAVYIVYIASLSNLGGLFRERRTTIIGVYMACSIAGLALLAPVTEALISATSARTAMVALGIGAGLVTIVSGFFVRSAPTAQADDTAEPIASRQSATRRPLMEVSPRGMLRSPLFYVLFVTLATISVVGFVFQSTGAVIAEQSVGLDSAGAAIVISVFSFASAAGAVAIGLVADRRGMWLALAGIAAAQVAISAVLALGGIGVVAVYFAAAGILGLCYGAAGTLFPTIVMWAFGEQRFGRNIALMSLQAVVPAFLAPQLAVSFEGATLFLICAVISAAAIPLAIVIRVLAGRYTAKRDRATGALEPGEVIA